MKYKTIGAFKNVENIPYCKASVDMKVAMGVILDRVNKTANLPASDEECKACHYMVTNINDKPECRTMDKTRTVKAGEHVRADDLTTVANLEIEFANFEISGGTAAVGDKLVFGTDGLLAVSADVADYKIYFEVIELTSYMDGGVLAVIREQ